MKDLQGKKVNVTEFPKTFFNLHNDKEVKEVLRKIQMEDYFSLPPWGVDYQRSYELMTTLNMEGHAMVTNLEDKKVQIEVTTETIGDALKLRQGYFSLTDKITD